VYYTSALLLGTIFGFSREETGFMVLELIQNVAFLVALAVGLQMLARRMEGRPVLYGLVTGLLFGGVGIIGMMTPMHFAPGVIYDGRSIVLSLAGLFGSPIAAAIAAVMCGVYRVNLGGAGALAGVLTIAESAMLGAGLYYLRRHDDAWVRPLRLLAFALLVHVLMLAAQLLIPEIGFDVVRRVGPSVLIFYPVGFLLIAQVFLDGERRRKAVEALRVSERRYREIMENANSIIFRIDPEGNVTFLNEFAERFLGFSRDEILGRNIVGTIVPAMDSTGNNLADLIQGILLNPELHTNVENENTCKDGTRVWVAWTNKPIYDEDGRFIELLCIGNDITKRKRAEEALKESESRWQFALEGAGDGVWDWNLQTNKLFFSRRWKEMLGYKEEEIGDSLDEWDRRVHPDDRDHCYSDFDRHFRGETIVYQNEHRLLCKDGSYKWILDRGKVIQRESDGKPLRFIGTHSDITDRKHAEAEREKLEEQLLQSQKMEAVGQLAGGVAHDFNNLLQIILGNVDVIQNDLDQGIPNGDAMEEVRKAAERAAELTRQLLAFSRRQVIQPVTLNLNDLVQGMLKMIRRLIGEHIELCFISGDHPGMVHADKGQIEQILLNLCVNARDAMQKGGRLTIATDNIVIGDSFIVQHPWARNGRYVLLSVMDTGQGMDDATRSRIFEPFFTTKGMGHGTGLGLATVYGIVKHHNGMIHVYSELGKGTVFKVYLPMIDNLAEDVIEKTESPVGGGAETILVAEDEEMVRELVVRLLESAGYTVLSAFDGEEALKVFDGHMDEIDMAILDVMMPKLGGREVMDSIQRKCPRIRFLFSSGYSENAIHTDFVIKEGLRLITKPYRRDDLLRAVRETIDRPEYPSTNAGS
jgi:two-component system, cell cycle sensor histidine kinase and response regulator CckA